MFAGKNMKGRDTQVPQQIHDDAVDLFLEALRAWGPISSLKARLKIHHLTLNDADGDLLSQKKLFNEAEVAFVRRMTQSAETYLQYNPAPLQHQAQGLVNSANLPSGVTKDSLFELDTLMSTFQVKLEKSLGSPKDSYIQVILFEVLAEMCFMKGSYKESLFHFLDLASCNHKSMSQLGDEAIQSLTTSLDSIPISTTHKRYKHVLTMIEKYDLQKALLEKRSGGRIVATKALPPIASLIYLVGFQYSGDFIIQHCTMTIGSRSDLPINHVEAQLREHRKLLYWFLQRIFIEKPEIYVQCPATDVLPKSITDLHQTHFKLHLEFADRNFDENKKLTAIPTFDEQCYESPLLQFLKVSYSFLV